MSDGWANLPGGRIAKAISVFLTIVTATILVAIVGFMALLVVVTREEICFAAGPNAHRCNARNEAREICSSQRHQLAVERARQGSPYQVWVDMTTGEGRFDAGNFDMESCISANT